MSNYQQHQGQAWPPQQQAPYPPQQPQTEGWAQQAPTYAPAPPQQPYQAPVEPAAPPASRFGSVNWRAVKISIPIIVLALGLITVLAWPSINRQINPPVAMYRLVPPATETVRGQQLQQVPATADDRPGTDAETQATGRNKQFLGLVRLDTTYSPDGTQSTPPGYQVFAAYGDIADPAARMAQAVANIKVAGAKQLGPMRDYPAKGHNAGDVPIRCTGVSISDTASFGWCTWANRSTIGTVTLLSATADGPSPDDLAKLAADTVTLRDGMYAAH
ncbi:hypothetical protein P3T37_006689 [Kitasatospora sp. MAA4]|uniref:hypothetical protein n=1 Tax=Kitasatospora sp. MAA4 TaxID=3035093 RepID=UPI002474558A|nr:hypothetical protein [Kitasatospora sp. MAA4]MDH6137257.1 hypothetical protein [Kitasatospora sp. MAA4]